MKIGHIELPVSDPKKSLSFYRDTLGFSVETVQGERYVWLRSGDVEVLLNPDLKRDPVGASGQNVVLYTPELASAVQRLRERGVPMEERGNCHHFMDPDGNRFQLVNPGDVHSSE